MEIWPPQVDWPWAFCLPVRWTGWGCRWHVGRGYVANVLLKTEHFKLPLFLSYSSLYISTLYELSWELSCTNIRNFSAIFGEKNIISQVVTHVAWWHRSRVTLVSMTAARLPRRAWDGEGSLSSAMSVPPSGANCFRTAKHKTWLK